MKKPIINQQKISLLEGKEVIEPEVLKQVAKALGISPEVIKNFDESVATNFINTFMIIVRLIINAPSILLISW